MIARFPLPMALLSLLSNGAIFGFFFAWVCSTMWGLDATDPRIAITSMQAMNASVRNFVFFPAFFLTPVILVMTSYIAFKQRRNRSAIFFASSAALYVAGPFLVTIMVNVPMNEELARVVVPTDSMVAGDIWQAYSTPWQLWNTIRTLVSGLALGITGLAIYSLNPRTA